MPIESGISISTHSRAKAAGNIQGTKVVFTVISTHSRAKAAGKKRLKAHELSHISTHSRAKAAGKPSWRNRSVICYFNSQPREGGWHTPYVNQAGYFYISTHSRAKAAGRS